MNSGVKISPSNHLIYTQFKFNYLDKNLIQNMNLNFK